MVASCQHRKRRKNLALLAALFLISGMLYGIALIRMKGLLF